MGQIDENELNWNAAESRLKESILFALKITKYLGKDFAHDLESGWAKNKIKTLI